MSLPGANMDTFLHMWVGRNWWIKFRWTQAMLPYPPKFTGIFSATVQHSRGEISICFLSLQTQDSRGKFTSQIHLFICTIFLFKLYLLIVLNFATNKTQLKLGVVFILDFFHAQSTDLKQFGYSFISILWITFLCSRLQKEQSEGCFNNNKVDGVMW